MNIVLWILQVLLAVMFLMAGIMKLMQPYDRFIEKMAWAEDFSPTQIKLIGGLEVLGAIGLIIPWLTGILPILTPLAAVGLILTMSGAALTHLKRKEFSKIIMNLMLGAMAAFAAYGRFFLEM